MPVPEPSFDKLQGCSMQKEIAKYVFMLILQNILGTAF